MGSKTNQARKTEANSVPARIKVRATRLGYYNHMRRRKGDVFWLEPVETVRNGKRLTISAEQQFSENWMERVDPGTPEKVSTAQSSINQQHDEIIAGRVPGTPTGDAEVI